MQPRRKVIDANKQVIMREAKTMFRKRGFAATTMDSVAKASGMSKSTVYVYFKSKDDIFLHIILDGLIAVRDAVQGLAGVFSTIESFHQGVCEFLVEIHDRDPVFFSGMMGSGFTDATRFAPCKLVNQIDAVREEIMAIIIEAFARSGYGESADMEQNARLELGYVLWSCIYGIIQLGEAQSRSIAERFEKDRRAFMRTGFDKLLKLLIHACDSPTRNCRS